MATPPPPTRARPGFCTAIPARVFPWSLGFPGVRLARRCFDLNSPAEADWSNFFFGQHPLAGEKIKGDLFPA